MLKLILLLLLGIALGLAAARSAGQEPRSPKRLEVHPTEELRKKRDEAKRAYLPFLRRSSMHLGIYHLAKGSVDEQSPHPEDEVYYVLRGRAQIRVEGETRAVSPGDVIYVAARAEHRFEEIEEDLDLLVFFSTGPIDGEEGG